MKSAIKKAVVVFLCGLLFFGIAYTYLHFNFNKQSSNADQKQNNVPYKIYPENKGIAWVIQNSSAVITYLDFQNECIKIIDMPQFDENKNLYKGYSIDYTVWGNYALIEGIVDRIGGLNLKHNGEELRYTGNQVVELISGGCDNELQRQIFTEVFSQITKSDFSKSNFVYIIENCKSTLSIIDCIPWVDYIPDMCKNIILVD